MRSRQRTFRQSFVVTVVASSGTVAASCSDAAEQGAVAEATQEMNGTQSSNAGSTTVTSNGSTSSGSTETSSSGGGAAMGASTTGSSGAIDNDPRCPATWAEAFPFNAVNCDETGLTCEYVLECSSGTRAVRFTCAETFWEGPTGCDPYDFCTDPVPPTESHGADVYCEDGEFVVEGWAIGVSNPPGPCPAELPADGEDCQIFGGTGGSPDRAPCGFPCDGDPEKWTVLSCTGATEEMTGVWTSDGACGSGVPPSSSEPR